MKEHPVIDGRSVAAALRDAGLMPPVIGLGVQDEPESGGHVLIVSVLDSIDADAVSQIDRVLGAIRYELTYVAFDDDGRRLGVDYRSRPASG